MSVQITDWNTAQNVGQHIFVGSAFAFLTEKVFDAPGLAWIRRMLPSPGPQVISLLGPEPVEVPGAKIDRVRLPGLRLAGLVSDKSLYREGRETVNLFVFDPLSPDRSLTLDIRANGQDFSRLPVRLNARGAAAVSLRDLPGGDYAVRLANADAPACTFTVAEYKLAPLVASMADRTMDGGQLKMKLRLESFGTPVEGPVSLELTDRGHRLATSKGTAAAGIVETSFKLEGEGPHAVNVQLVNDPSKTATVPITGSRASERSTTTFSTLGTHVTGTLLPSEGARCVRGLWLEDGATEIVPLSLERVDARVARLTARAAVRSVRIVVIDPTFPAARGVQRPAPAEAVERYNRGEKLFQAGDFKGALALFEAEYAVLEFPHPSWAYFIACCHARIGDRVKAIAWLRASLEDGWTDLKHMAGDSDLESLRGMAEFDGLCTAGYREIAFDAIPEGKTVEIALPGPLSILAVGAFQGTTPVEGWAALVAPDADAPKVHVPDRAEPGTDVTVDVECGDAAVWLVVKDARLLTGDTPASLLAGRMKSMVDGTGKTLKSGPVTETLPRQSPPGYGGDATGIVYSAMPPPRVYSAVPPMAAMPVPSPAPAPKMIGAAPPRPAAPKPMEAQGPGAMKLPSTAVEEPEVLFAGLVESVKGRASVTVRLGPSFADYVVDAFVLSGLEWTSIQSRFRAEKSPFIALDVPAFVHPADAAGGGVIVGAGPSDKVRVTRDGQDVEVRNGTFVAEPGDYVAVVEDGGRRDVAEKRVDEPGKLKRVAKTLKLLEKGGTVTRTPDMVALRVLPGLEKPFSALIEATADYGHACCEQTAAKMMAACAMFATARDERTRAKAESIIIAGVKREGSMWLKGRGFKMYPESENSPHTYYGPKASRYLQNLALLKELGPSPALAKSIAAGLEMANDGCKAYGLVWPPQAASTCEEAYAVVRFGEAKWREKAMAFVADRSRERLPEPPKNPYMGGAVASRMETAYAAAALLRAGDRARGLQLANEVTKALGPEGRLYSTCDSVAAIALLSELKAAGIVGGAGGVEIDGRVVQVTDAVEAKESVRCTGGVAPVEIVRIVEEDWSKFAATVPFVVSLEKAGKAARVFAPGDAIDLRVKLKAAYKTGDLVWVCLPDSLSRVVGGGQVKRFSVDFAGADEVVVPLAATGLTIGKDGKPATQRYAVCVRNMFEEERAGNPGMLEVSVRA